MTGLIMNKLTEDDIKELERADSDEQWNVVCDRVKAENGNQYPSDWYEKVIKTGMIGGFEARKDMAAARRRRAKYKMKN